MAATSEQAQLIEMAKKAAAYTAVKDHFDPRFKHVGIGSGSTVVYVVEAIKELHADASAAMTFYTTGAGSRALVEKHGLAVGRLQDLPAAALLDVYFDGADEVDEDLNLIKGGGACLWQEKIVALASRTFVCVADYRKLGSRLGTNWKQGIPIEVHPMRANQVLAALERLGSRSPLVRPDPLAPVDPATGRPVALMTDNHMVIIDAPFMPLVLPARDTHVAGDGTDGIWDVEKLARAIKDIDGVCEIGLFYGYSGLDKPGQGGAQKPVAAYFGMADGSVQVQNQGAPPVTITTEEAP